MRDSMDLTNWTEASVVQTSPLKGGSEVLGTEANNTTKGSIMDPNNCFEQVWYLPPAVTGAEMASTLLLGKAED